MRFLIVYLVLAAWFAGRDYGTAVWQHELDRREFWQPGERFSMFASSVCRGLVWFLVIPYEFGVMRFWWPTVRELRSKWKR